jgi:hypothetical protein
MKALMDNDATRAEGWRMNVIGTGVWIVWFILVTFIRLIALFNGKFEEKYIGCVEYLTED